jgi:cyclopropane-fatty-acyl-phospholipid synthase
MPDRTQAQLAAAKRLAAHIAERLQADLSLKLWDGTVLPLGPEARRDIVVAIRSPAAVRRLMFSPRLMTIVELYASGDLDIEGGTPLEAARRWDHMNALRLARSIDKGLVAKSLWPFLRAGDAGVRSGTAGFGAQVEARHEAARQRQGADPVPLRRVERFYALFRDAEMGLSRATRPGPTGPRRGADDKFERIAAGCG